MRKQKKLDLDGQLPPDVKASDLKWPKTGALSWTKQKELGLETTRLTFYKTTGFGWVLLTLGIRRARRQGQTDRSYAVTMDGRCCRVGLGPHVLQTVEVCLSEANLGRLQKYVDLYLKGGADAGNIRDRISSRRAEGQLRRASGQTSWFWSH